MIASNSVNICDHCSKSVDELWVDSNSWHLCPICWSLYHDYKPKKECNYMTFEKVEKEESSMPQEMTDEMVEATHKLELAAMVYLEAFNKLHKENPPVVWIKNDGNGKGIFISDSFNTDIIIDYIENR
jgi:hypothetical protein